MPRRDKERSRGRVRKLWEEEGRRTQGRITPHILQGLACIRALGARFGGALLTYILVHIVTQHRHDLL